MTTATLNYAGMKLGKLAPKNDPRTLQLGKYLDLAKLPPVPHQCGWQGHVTSWGMMGNDRIGDCTCAAVGHQVQAWTLNSASEVTLPDSDIIGAYSAITGYDPHTGANDNGAMELDVLNFWRNTGIGGHKIGAYADANPKHHAMVKAAIWLFGGVYVGAGLPIAAQSQDIWTVTKGPNAQPGSWGGHAFVCIAYSPSYVWCVTWGELKAMTWGWWSRYVDEAHVPLSTDWFSGNATAPSGFDLATLTADLQAVTA